MDFFSKFPYSNAYQLNLDWIIALIKKFESDYNQLDPDSFLRKSGGVLDGTLYVGEGGRINMGGHDLSGLKDAINSGDAVPLRQVQASFVKKSGDTMTGVLNMGDNSVTGLPSPVAASDAANKDYVDRKIGTPAAPGAYLPLAGGSMSGDIDMDGHFIKNLPNAVADGDALSLAFAKTLFAPSGYGLGKESGRVCLDANQAVTSGFYQASGSNFQNGPAEYTNLWFGVLFVQTRANGTYIQQRLTQKDITAVRYCEDGVWSPWEYENPPMALGVEYRTAERWNAKAVYTKLIDCGTAVNGSSVSKPDGAKIMLRYEGNLYKTAETGIPLPVGTIGTNYFSYLTSNSENSLSLVTGSASDGYGSGAFSLRVTMWYTKD